MRGTLAIVGLAALLSACSGNPAASDTGYVGTWSRGTDKLRSIVSIARVGDAYKFRWGKLSRDGRLKLICDWDGVCEEIFDGERVATYLFRAWLDAESGHLRVECTETRTVPAPFKQHFIDELVVDPGGLVLWSYTIERDGETFPLKKGPRRSFDKVGDGIVAPPRGSS